MMKKPMSQNAPTGKPLMPNSSARMKTFLNQPPTSAVAVGQVWDWTLVMMEPKPMDIICVPRVAMKGGSFSLATRTPLTKPNAMPTNSVSAMARISGQPCLNA